jgi:hypothetical protein
LPTAKVPIWLPKGVVAAPPTVAMCKTWPVLGTGIRASGPATQQLL